jgi:hypothetical protein
MKFATYDEFYAAYRQTRTKKEMLDMLMAVPESWHDRVLRDIRAELRRIEQREREIN